MSPQDPVNSEQRPGPPRPLTLTWAPAPPSDTTPDDDSVMPPPRPPDPQSVDDLLETAAPGRSQFLSALFSRCNGEPIEFRALSKTEPPRTAFFDRQDADRIATFIAEAITCGIFVGVATRADRSSGKLENCQQLPALFVDFDFKDMPEREVRRRLAEFPIPPSLVTRTGGGLHAYWLLDVPITLSERASDAKALLRRLARALGGDLNAAEPARVLRVPGAVNYKYDPPWIVELETCEPDRRYPLRELEAALPAASTESTTESGPFRMPDEPLDEGEGRNSLLYRLGRSLKARRLSPEAIRAALEIENGRFKAPLPADELEQVLNNVFTQADRPDFRASSNGTDHETDTAASGRLMTVAEVQAKIGNDVTWVVDGMFAVGDLSVTTSLPGVGKSTFNAQLARDVSKGEPFLGRQTKRGLVIILAFEGARSTVARLIELGHDPTSDQVLMWIAEGNPQDPLTWLRRVVGDRQPVLIIVDTLTDFASIRHGAANAGYQETIGKLGPVYAWALAHGTHMHFSHHSNKVDGEDITAALGTIGIVGKPGTILNYRRLDPKDAGSPRVLRGVKHREGDLVRDLPATVLDLEPGTKRLRVIGTKEAIDLCELGMNMIRVVRQAGRIRQWGEDGLLAAVEGRKVVKLEALRLLTREAGGVLLQAGTAKSRTDPATLTLRLDVVNHERAWRELFESGGPR